MSLSVKQMQTKFGAMHAVCIFYRFSAR